MTLLIFLLVLSVLVLAHELGHFLAAKKAGIKIEEFGFGLPPRLLGKKIGQTIYSINALPFGGFVRLAGEDSPSQKTLPQKQFIYQPKKIKIAVLSAGVVMNLLLALSAFSLVYSIAGIPTQTDRVTILEIIKDSPAQNAGLAPQDIILAIDDQPIKSISQFTKNLDQKRGQPVTLSFSRSNKEDTVTLIPRPKPPEGEGAIGVVISQIEIVYPPFWQRPFLGAWYGIKEAVFWGWATITGLLKLLSDLIFSGIIPKDIAGPVGIYQLTGLAAKAGWLSVINFIGILSVNLAIINFLPFPALDGGRLLFVVLEKFRGRPVSAKIEQAVHIAGIAFLISLLLAITANDILRLTGAENISELVTRLFPN